MNCPNCGDNLQFTCKADGTIVGGGVAINGLRIVDDQQKVAIYCTNDCVLSWGDQQAAAEFLVPYDAFGRPPGCRIEGWEAPRPPHDPSGYGNQPVPFLTDGRVR